MDTINYDKLINLGHVDTLLQVVDELKVDELDEHYLATPAIAKSESGEDIVIIEIPSNDTTIETPMTTIDRVATHTTRGLMSASDKMKLDSLGNALDITVTKDNNGAEIINPEGSYANGVLVIDSANLLTNISYNGISSSLTFTSNNIASKYQPCIVFSILNNTQGELDITMPSEFGGISVVPTQGQLSKMIPAGSTVEFNLLSTNGQYRLIIL